MDTSNKNKFLVTGGAGAIGSYIVNKLAMDPNNHIDVIDDLSSGYEINLNFADNVFLHQGSITNKEFLQKFTDADYKYVFHIAALFANQNSVDHPLQDLNVNIEGTLNMLEISRTQKNFSKFVYTSSSCIYGNSSSVMQETDKPNPDTPYAISKLSGEYYTNYFFHHYKLPANTLRLFNIYGSNEHPGKYRNVIPNFVYKALNGLDIPIHGEGDQKRDFTYIEDAWEMFQGVYTDKENSGEIFNIGCGSETSVLELAQKIIQLSGSTSKIVHTPFRDWDTVKVRKASTSKVIKYKNNAYSTLDKGLLSVINFVRKYSKVASAYFPN